MYRIGGRPIWSWDNWFLDPARSGGPIVDLSLHDIDFVNDLLGMPDRIQATARTSPATGSYDTIHALFTYDDGPQIHIRGGWSMAQIPFQAGFDAWFERGFIRLDGRNDPPLQVFDNLTKAEARAAEYEKGDAYYDEIAYFLRCVETGTQPDRCSPRSTRDSLVLIERALEAIESGETIKKEKG
jgi:predicted dehydrogenase